MHTCATFVPEIPAGRARILAGVAAWLLSVAFLTQTLAAQTLQEPASSDLVWSRIGGTVVASGLASPSTGPVATVWFAANGRRILAQTAAGRVFETSDLSHWRLNTSDAPVEARTAAGALPLPEPGAKVLAAARSRLYAATDSNLYSSEDNGRTWLNLTGFNGRSIIGGGFTALTVSPTNPSELVAANGFGIWRSLDSGLSWRGIHEDLPNLGVRKLLTSRSVLLEDGLIASIAVGTWSQVEAADPEQALLSRLALQSRRSFASAVQSGQHLYAGTSDGRLFSSRDNGATWMESPRPSTAPIDRLWVDDTRTDSALAVSGSRLLRTTNGGLFWDDVTGSLPSAAIHGVVADRSGGVVYVATDRGLFLGTLSLDAAGPAASEWRSVSRNLPVAAVWDVRLGLDNTLTVALDGYGVFETTAPHRTRSIRILNGADMTERAAAPGSLVGVQGADVRRAMVGGVNWPVLGSTDRNSQLQVPFESVAGIYQISMEGPTGRWSAPLAVKEASPAIFVDSDGAPLLLDAASGLVMDPSAAIHASSTIQLLTTGLGKVTPDWPTGLAAPFDAPPAVRGTVTAYLDGTPVEVTRATLAPGYVGYYIVELRIPAILNRGASELRLSMNGEESNRVRLYLEPELAAK